MAPIDFCCGAKHNYLNFKDPKLKMYQKVTMENALIFIPLLSNEL